MDTRTHAAPHRRATSLAVIPLAVVPLAVALIASTASLASPALAAATPVAATSTTTVSTTVSTTAATDTRTETTLHPPTVRGNTLIFDRPDLAMHWTIDDVVYVHGDVVTVYGTVQVDASLDTSTTLTHRVVGPTSWTLHLPAKPPTSATDPVVGPGTIDVTPTDGIVYEHRRVGETHWQPLTDRAVGYGLHDVRAIPATHDDTLAGTTLWENLDARHVHTTPPAPTMVAHLHHLTIPDAVGLTYHVNGEPKAPGNHSAVGISVVTVRYDHDVATGPAAGPWFFDTRQEAQFSAPTRDPRTGTVTIPDATYGVQYIRDHGTPLTGGDTIDTTHQQVRIRVEALPSHFVAPGTTTEWEYFPTAYYPTLATSRPRVDASTATVTIPHHPGVRYVSSSRGVLAPGPHRIQMPRETISAQALNPSFPDSAPHTTHTWTFDGRPAHTPVGPTLRLDRGEVTAPLNDPHFTYHLLSDALAAPGSTITPLPAGRAVAVAEADAVIARPVDPNSRIADGATGRWFLDYTDVTPVVPLAPTLGADAQTLWIPDVHGVEYRVDGTPVPAGTRVLTQQVSVTAHPASLQFVIRGADTWTLDARQSLTAPAPTLDVTGAHPTITIPHTSGATYRVNGKDVAPGTHRVTLPATVELVVVDAGVIHTGARRWSFTAPPAKPGTTPPSTTKPTKPAPAPLVKVKAAKPRVSANKARITLVRTPGVTYKVKITTRGKPRANARARFRTITFGRNTRVVRLSKKQTATIRVVARPGHRLTGTTTWKVTRR